MKIEIPRGCGIKVGVYKIATCLSENVYIGGSFQSFTHRSSRHLKDLNENVHHCKHLQYAYNKYSKDSFTFSILEKYDKKEFKSKEEMIKFVLSREQYYLDIYPKELKYNTVETAGTNAGFKHTEEFKKKKSDQYKGRACHPNSVNAMKLANTGRIVSQETRDKISKIHKGRPHTPEQVKKAADKLRGGTLKNKRNILFCKPENYKIKYVFKTDIEAAKFIKVAPSTIRVSAANCKKLKGYILMYDSYPIINKRSKYKKVIEYDKVTKKVVRVWNSKKEFAISNNISEGRIKHILSGVTKQIKDSKTEIMYEHK